MARGKNKTGRRSGGSGRRHSGGGRAASYRVPSSSFQRNGADDGNAVRGGRSNGRLDFEDSPLAAGESRLAYRCRVQGGCYRGYTEGSYCIFKVFKPEEEYGSLVVDAKDVSMQRRSKTLASEFTAACKPEKHGSPCKVIVRDAALGEFEDSRDLLDDRGNYFRVHTGSPFLLEREIRGDFEKFTSNSGWSSGRDPILDAFSHWTWVHSGEREVVCDLQGHCGDGSLPHLGDPYYYLLTDPAICSSGRDYGVSDLGQAGIDAFFQHHVCNEWCRKLDIDYEKPQYSTRSIPKRRGTSYFGLT